MVQFKWNNNVFSVSKKNYQRIKELSESFKIKKKSDGTSSTVVITGSELQTFSFDIPIINTLNSDPRKVYELWRKQLGMSAPMLAQDALFGPNNVRLNKVSLKSDKISNAGVLLFATLTLTFEEDEKQGKNFKSKAMPYISPIKRAYFKDEPQAVENLILKVFYNEKDITDAIDVNTCIHDMYACSRADSLLLTFNDVNKVWDKWKPNKEELISIVCGVAKSGRMFIESVTPENGLMTLIASSCPPTSKKKNNKSWENIWFLQLGKEIADRHNLAFESYGVQDRLYSYVRQENEPDFDFLQKDVN